MDFRLLSHAALGLIALRIPLRLCFPFTSWTATHPTIPGSRPLHSVTFPTIHSLHPAGSSPWLPCTLRSIFHRLLARSSHFGSLSIPHSPKTLLFDLLHSALHHLAFALLHRHSAFIIPAFALRLHPSQALFCTLHSLFVIPHSPLLREASCIHPSPCAFGYHQTFFAFALRLHLGLHSRSSPSLHRCSSYHLAFALLHPSSPGALRIQPAFVLHPAIFLSPCTLCHSVFALHDSPFAGAFRPSLFTLGGPSSPFGLRQPTSALPHCWFLCGVLFGFSLAPHRFPFTDSHSCLPGPCAFALSDFRG